MATPIRSTPRPTAPPTHDWDHLVQRDRVHRALYTDPAIFDLEMIRIFGGTWVFLGHESEIAKPNDFITRKMGRRPLILTRDAKGKVHAVFNRCMHRGATVCREAHGSARYFTCGYHGWVYNNAGELISAPLDHAYGKGFDRSRFHLARVPFVDTYRGFIWGTLNPEPQPLHEHLGHARDYLDQWIDRSPTGEVFVRSAKHPFVYRGNWKLAYDNAGDGYHPAYSHQSLLMIAQRFGEPRDMQYFGGNPDESRMYALAIGNGNTFIDQRPEMYASSGWGQQRPQPGREYYEEKLRARFGDEEAARYLELAIGAGMNLSIFPNLLIVGNQIQLLQPLAVDRTDLTWYATTIGGVPDEINVLRMRTQEDFPSLGEVDDVANWEACQEGFAVPEVEWIDFSRHLDNDVRKTDERGITRTVVTDDMHMRVYYAEWKRLMSREEPLSVG
jgi:phenylpropionate dioxygenase-like ring-hydroxylating dioxygenase large terminal subunit